MQKPQIHWKYQNPSRSSLRRGWTQLSRTSKAMLIIFNLLSLSFSIYLSIERQSAFGFGFNLLMICCLTISILHVNGFEKKHLVSLIEQLDVTGGAIRIGDYQLPDTVRKVVIGRVDIQGPAYLQLSWNQGNQWIFPVDEIQQVRHFFREHAPQIEIVNE